MDSLISLTRENFVLFFYAPIAIAGLGCFLKRWENVIYTAAFSIFLLVICLAYEAYFLICLALSTGLVYFALSVMKKSLSGTGFLVLLMVHFFAYDCYSSNLLYWLQLPRTDMVTKLDSAQIETNIALKSKMNALGIVQIYRQDKWTPKVLAVFHDIYDTSLDSSIHILTKDKHEYVVINKSFNTAYTKHVYYRVILEDNQFDYHGESDFRILEEIVYAVDYLDKKSISK